MSAFDAFLSTLTVFNRDNFRGNTWKILAQNIFYMIFVLMIVLSVVLASMLVFLQCIATGLDITTQSFPLSIVIELLRSVLMYMSISSKNRLITDTIGRLQEVIMKRECYIISALRYLIQRR